MSAIAVIRFGLLPLDIEPQETGEWTVTAIPRYSFPPTRLVVVDATETTRVLSIQCQFSVRVSAPFSGLAVLGLALTDDDSEVPQ